MALVDVQSWGLGEKEQEIERISSVGSSGKTHACLKKHACVSSTAFKVCMLFHLLLFFFSHLPNRLRNVHHLLHHLFKSRVSSEVCCRLNQIDMHLLNRLLNTNHLSSSLDLVM